jgi:hypothetical protein
MNTIEHRLQTLEQQIKNLQFENKLLKQQLNSTKQDKCESFFQKYLESKFDASHSKNIFGITDIETSDKIIEIKRWNQYKTALGQLVSYNNGLNKQLIVYFFGKKPQNSHHIINLFKQHHISTYHIYQNNIDEIIEVPLYEDKNDFIKWLQSHIAYKKDSVLRLQDVCELYLGRNVNTRIMTTYKKQIEIYIQSKFSDVNSLYQNTTYNSKSYRGWLHLTLVA